MGAVLGICGAAQASFFQFSVLFLLYYVHIDNFLLPIIKFTNIYIPCIFHILKEHVFFPLSWPAVVQVLLAAFVVRPVRHAKTQVRQGLCMASCCFWEQSQHV